VSIGVFPYVVFLHKWFLGGFSGIIRAMMKYQYTTKQFAEFRKFCLRHNLKFATMAEFQSALKQYFKD
jgi:3,4-dihydroxy-2-butanone 4-phosphate synthase